MLLEIRDVNVHLERNGATAPILENIYFKLETGAVAAWIGESGCGKTTLANTILQLLPSEMRLRGSIQFDGVDLLKLDERAMRALRGKSIGMIPQEPALALNPVLRAGAQVEEALRNHRIAGGADARRLALDAMRGVGLDDAENIYKQYAHRLSGGMRQRVAIAAALVAKPKLLIADEATTALDPTLRIRVFEYFEKLRRENGMSIIYISHDLPAVARLAESMEVFYAGRIVESAPRERLERSPMHPYTRALLDCSVNIIQSIPGAAPAPAQRSRGCAFHPRCALREERCEREVPEMATYAENHRAACHVTVREARP
ncbi:MAG: ABC transporter ATP-binding protein [Planctomycetes bacterium]|nr:ABC transporter ATP-binding protein [Planctomycetota bacterium]